MRFYATDRRGGENGNRISSLSAIPNKDRSQRGFPAQTRSGFPSGPRPSSGTVFSLCARRCERIMHYAKNPRNCAGRRTFINQTRTRTCNGYRFYPVPHFRQRL